MNEERSAEGTRRARWQDDYSRDVSCVCAENVQSQGQRGEAQATIHFLQLGVAPSPFQSGKDMMHNAGPGLPTWAASGLSASVLSQTRSPCAAERSGTKDFLRGRVSQLIDLDGHTLKALLDALRTTSRAESK